MTNRKIAQDMAKSTLAKFPEDPDVVVAAFVVLPVGPAVVDPVGPAVVDPVGPAVVDPVGAAVVEPVGAAVVEPVVVGLDVSGLAVVELAVVGSGSFLGAALVATTKSPMKTSNKAYLWQTILLLFDLICQIENCVIFFKREKSTFSSWFSGNKMTKSCRRCNAV